MHKELVDILSLKRGHGSVGERKFLEQFITPLEPVVHINPDDQTVAAYSVVIPAADGTACPVLWSCHVDTVHDPKDDAKQLALYDAGTSLFYKQDGKPLGADDGAGVWLFLQMIDRNVPGTYLFHRGEERGGIGSKAMAKHHSGFIKTHTHAIAFDRRDTCSVITHQSRGRCCSDKFATHFAVLLSDSVYGLKPDSGGIYTDTAEYTGLVGECTNVSVGYFNEHGGSEVLDMEYLSWLLDRLLNLDIATIHSVSERNAGDPDPDWLGRYAGYYKGYGAAYDDNWTNYRGLSLVPDEDEFQYDAYRDHTDVTKLTTKALTKWVRKADTRDIVELIQSLADDAAYFADELMQLEVDAATDTTTLDEDAA